MSLPLLLALALVPSDLPSGTGLEGHWRNPSETVVIVIGPCGTELCGRVQWASEKATVDARKGGTDPLVGATLLSRIVARGPNRWDARLFVPDLNRTSKAQLRVAPSGTLKVTGCAVGRMICKSQIWTRTEPR
ncbi:DUF2147 domain-containing protein [Sphingomonas rhizophila]|uniref:DUF2147 domain-containing protein n=1 Tax=Sphingomonas rhizophila TaxID=2071607 RepID=A0A7G9SC82_9SPHN|nr:DUF2147 domain-containing protein [Sphingomonas rhizophila]QNN65457.1 DUF2147 domain-containing protein [Sphingomonas rhizophila]